MDYEINTETPNLKVNQNTSLEISELYDVPIGIILLLAFCYGIVSLCAIIGNGIVLWMVCKSTRMRTVTNIFLANLASADILIGALAIPFQFQAALLQRWVLPEFMCPFCPFIQVISVNVSIFTLTAIAIERYRVVVKPLWPRMNKSKAQLIIVIIWLVSIVTAIPMYIALGVTMVPDDVAINNNTNLTELLTAFLNSNSSNLNTVIASDNNLTGKMTYELTIPMKPFCHNAGLQQDLFKNYNRFLVLIQYFLPLLLISSAYGRMGFELYGGKSKKNKRRQIQRRENILRKSDDYFYNYNSHHNNYRHQQQQQQQQRNFHDNNNITTFNQRQSQRISENDSFIMINRKKVIIVSF